jgi:branched-chain amino acid transport system ATP-binding protein
MARTSDLLRRFGLTEVAGRPAGTLPYGQQRRVELARAIIARPQALLVDEPAAGLNEAETADLAALLRWAVEDLDCAMLLIDHDVEFIMTCCGRVEVLRTGRMIFEGTPAAAREDPEVREAYLGAAR